MKRISKATALASLNHWYQLKAFLSSKSTKTSNISTSYFKMELAPRLWHQTASSLIQMEKLPKATRMLIVQESAMITTSPQPTALLRLTFSIWDVHEREELQARGKCKGLRKKERNGGRDPAVRPNHIHQTHKTLGKSCFPNTNVSNTWYLLFNTLNLFSVQINTTLVFLCR